MNPMDLAWIIWFIVIPFEAVIWYHGVKDDADQEKDRRNGVKLPSLWEFVGQCEREREQQRLDEQIK